MPRPLRAEFPQPKLLSTTAELAALCQRLRAEPFVSIDTEFMREHTYWPVVCVIQLAGADEVAIVDTLAPGLNLDPLGALLADPAVTKVFHAARQDIEIFFLKFGDVPRPLFDTQIAAMVAGFGDQVGYDALVAALTGGEIEKAHRFSDWSVRPLSTAQVAYAAADVTHLRAVYEKLRARLEQEGRLGWVAEEMATLADPNTYRSDPETMWQRLRARTTSRRFLGMLRVVAAWREREAQRLNIPRQRVIRDESLLELAATAPDSPAGLARVRGISRGFAEGRSGASVLAAVAAGKTVPESQLPKVEHRGDGPRPSPALVSLLKVLLATKSEQHHVAPRLLASSEDIERLASEDEPDIPALRGWRREVYGADALALKEGRIALGVAGRRVRLLALEPADRAVNRGSPQAAAHGG